MLTAGIILAITYVGIAFTQLPRINVDRPAAALAGALAMVLAGVLTFGEAVDAIDFNTLALLLGMMLLVVVLQRGGLFPLLARRAVAVADTPAKLLTAVVVATAVTSALLVNDVVVLLFTPVVIQACRMQRVNPVPFLVGEAMASNIGSTATIVGNPQNMLIGVTSGISFARFFAHLAPVAVVCTILLLGVLRVWYRKELRPHASGNPAPLASAGAGAAQAQAGNGGDRAVLLRATAILAGVTVTFFVSSLAGLSIPLVALAAGTVAVLVSGARPSAVIRDVDWVLLLFFGGLFVVIGGARQSGVLDRLLEQVDLTASTAGIVSVHGFSAVVSQITSNVPLTVLVLPLLERVQGDTLWITLASAATLAGNATLLGAVANIIVAEQAYRHGVVLGFGAFLRVGLLVTALTMAASIGILLLQFHTGFLR